MISPPKEEWMSNGLIINNLPRPQGLIEVDYVADIGAGIRPFSWYKPKRLICVEPYKPYVDRLRSAGYDVIPDNALDFLEHTHKSAQTLAKENNEPRFKLLEAIYLLDVIEHMEKEEGLEVIEFAKRVAMKQIVIFTPHGFMQQTEDAWGLDGDYWQTHRSGWLPGEFPDWYTYRYAKGFYAILTI